MEQKKASRTPPPIDSADLPDSLLNFWYPVCYQSELIENEVFPTELFGEPLVLFRNKAGKAICIQDACPHRSTPLSIGFVKNGELYCRYHGWRFGGENGNCIAVPSLPGGRVPKAVKNQGHPVREAQKMIWIFPGDDKLAESVPLPTDMTEEASKSSDWPVVSQVWDSDYTYIQVMENLLDPCHLQFTHEGKQQKNICAVDEFVPGAFDFTAWDWRTDTSLPKWSLAAHIVTDETIKPMDYKILIEPASLQRAEITLKSGWKFSMNHYVTPLRPNKTRIFLKTARNFVKFVPEVSFAVSNDEVMQQDITVLTGQMMRLKQGASRWNFPVPADAASATYRKFWDNSLAKNPNVWFKEFTRSNVVKGPMEKGLVRAEAKDIEDLPAFVAPNSGISDHADGIRKLWQSPAALKWPTQARENGRKEPHFAMFGLVPYNDMGPKKICTLLVKFVAALLVLNAIIMGLITLQAQTA